MKKLGFLFWARITVIAIIAVSALWRLLTGQFLFPVSGEESFKIFLAFIIASYAFEAYEKSEENKKNIDLLASEIEDLKSEVEELRE